MTNLDQFESVFKSADKTTFDLESIELKKVIVATDLAPSPASDFQGRVRSFLEPIGQEIESWQCLSGEDTLSASSLLEQIEESAPHLICSYRNLHTPARQFPCSLGTHMDVLTQATSVPVLVFPHPEFWDGPRPPNGSLRNVMAITDHLTGDHHLVSFAARFTMANGTLWLTHVEDKVTLERYLRAIERIPAIDTDIARRTIEAQLLKEPRDYIASCERVLHDAGLPLSVETIVSVGHHLADYANLVNEHDIDLLVMNTKDEDQLAMHGLAYPLTIQLRDTPMLLL